MKQEDQCARAFETILSHSGKFGAYQKRLYVIISAMHVVSTSILTYMKFIPNMHYKQECVETVETLTNASFLFLGLNETVTFPIFCRSFYDNDLGLDLDWKFPKWAYPEFKHKNVRVLINYALCIGLGTGCVLGSILSDRLGRRRVMYVSFLLICVAQCAIAVLDNWIFFMACRAVVGLGTGGFVITSLVMVLEHVGHDWRDICIYLLPWWLGPSLLSLGAVFTRHWRHLALFSGFVGIPLLGTYFVVLESFRWLVCNHKFAQAEQTMKEIVSCNCRPIPDLITLFDICRKCVLNTMHKKTYFFVDLVTTNRLRKGTFAVVFTWFLGSVVYCGLFRGIRQLTSNPYLNNFVLYSTDAVIIVFAILINKCIGRRWCLFLYAMSSGLVSLCILVLHVSNETIDMSMINSLAFFIKLGVTTMLTIINLVTMETYPTVIRSMGLCVGFLASLSGYVFADRFLITYLEPYHYTVPFLVYGGMMCLLAISVLFFPETIKKPLPDILRCRHRTLCAHDSMRPADGWVM